MLDRNIGKAKIIRDPNGVPHVYAATRVDGHFGLGYALAEDWLPEMMARYAWAIGDTARLPPDRIFELGIRDAALSDFHVALWNHAEEARLGFDRLDKVWQDALCAFSDGIGAYAAAKPQSWPEWAPPLQPWFPLALSRAFLWFFATHSALSALGRHGVAAVRGASVLDILDMDLMGSSNAWVIMPERTADGSLIHVTDSHAQFHGVGRMTAFRIDCAAFKAAGTTVIGLPWLLKGHSPFTAWGWTDGGNRVSDCYSIRLDGAPAGPGEAVDESAGDVDRSAADGTDASISNRIRHAVLNEVRSPIVAEANGEAYAVCTPYMHRAGATDALMFRLQEASDRQSVLGILESLDLPATNLIIGTADGMALFAKPGRIPKRNPPYDGTMVVPAECERGRWAGFHPFGSQVHIVNPSAGFVQNCNGSADVMFDAQNVDPSMYAKEVFGDAPGLDLWRSKRLRHLLAASSKHDLNSALKILHDELWPDVPLWKGRIAAARTACKRAGGGTDAAGDALLDAIARFDGRAARTSREALVFYIVMTSLAEEGSVLRSLAGDAALETAEMAGFVRALRSAALRIAELDAESPATLGSVFVARTEEEDVPVGGIIFRADDASFTTLRNMFCRPSGAGGRMALVYGQRQPQLTVFGAKPTSFWRLLNGRRDDAGVALNAAGARATGDGILFPTLFDEDELLGVAPPILEIDTLPAAQE
ncbi:MAG: penicillin acylase family protein [Rhizomicrobium sp.]